MTEQEIFKTLFEVGQKEDSALGVVSSALVRDGVIVAMCPSSDTTFRHAEDLLLEKINNEHITILPGDILYTTLCPCGRRTPGGPGEKFGDCTTKIIASPVKKVLYAAADSHFSRGVQDRFASNGIECQQVSDPDIELKSRKLFLDTLTDEDYIAQRGTSEL